MQAPGQTSNRQTHHLRGNTWFLGSRNLAFLRPFPWPSPFWAAVSPDSSPEAVWLTGASPGPGELLSSSTVVQPLRGAAPPPVVNRGTGRGRPLRDSQETAARDSHGLWSLVRASEVPRSFWKCSGTRGAGA